MLTAYISAPFTSKTTKRPDLPFGKIQDREYIKFLERIAKIIQDLGFRAILPHKYVYEWGGTHYAPEKYISRAFNTLAASDLLIAYPEKSMGVNILIGWASMMRKKIIILLLESERVSIVQEGLKYLSEVKILKFTNIVDLEPKLKNAILELFPESQKE